MTITGWEIVLGIALGFGLIAAVISWNARKQREQLEKYSQANAVSADQAKLLAEKATQDARSSMQMQLEALKAELTADAHAREQAAKEKLERLESESAQRTAELEAMRHKLRATEELLDTANSIKQTVRSTIHGVGRVESAQPTAGTTPSIVSTPPAPPSVVFLERVELINIRCFERFSLSLVGSAGIHKTTLFLGDNAAGKSTVLRAIALAFCNESDAVSLMTSWPGNLLRAGAPNGEIRLLVRDSKTNETNEIVSTITKASDGSESLRRTVTIENQNSTVLPSIFVCGYGTQRTRAATASVESYSPRQAVSTLFDGGAPLQNPELVLLRHQSSFAALPEELLKVLLLDTSENSIDTRDGLRLLGPWGSIPLAALSDGYRSTFQWLVDLAGWLMLAGRLGPGRVAQGILLIDEIEQHLHPRWQRYVMQRLRALYPGLQIIATSHTPLIASGLADMDASVIVRLDRDGASIESKVINPDELDGKRADQVLTEIFGLSTTRNPSSSEELNRMVHLRSLPAPTEAEKAELAALEERLAPGMRFSESSFGRTVDEAVAKTLNSLIHKPPEKPLDEEVKRQLRDLLGVAPKEP